MNFGLRTRTLTNPPPSTPPPAPLPPRPRAHRDGVLLLREELCPDAGLHTPAPASYLAWHAWAQRQARTHHQVRCPSCGRWAVWVVGRPPLEPLSGPRRLRLLLRAAQAVLAVGQGNLRQPEYGKRVAAYDDLRDALEEYGQW